MKMTANTILKKVLWLNLFAIIFCIVGCIEERTPQKPPPQIPWIGDKRVGPGGISIPAGDDIYIGVSRDPENPQIKIKPGKGEIVIRIDVNTPHKDENGNPLPPHINIQQRRRNEHSDKGEKKLELSKNDRITIRIGDGKVVIEKNGRESIEYKLPDTEGLDITLEQEPGGKRTIVKKGGKVIGIIEIGEDATRIKVGDKEIEIPHNDEEEQKENDGEPGHENGSEGASDNEKGVNDTQKGLELRIQICPYPELYPDILHNPDPEPEIGHDLLPEPKPIPELGTDVLPNPDPEPEIGPDVLPEPKPFPEPGPDVLPEPKPIPELGPDVLPVPPIPELGPDVLPNPKPFPGILPRPLPKPEPGGVYIDLKISPDSFINEDKKENKSDAIDKSRPNKDSISWKFKCKE